jgi:hypothetical protein
MGKAELIADDTVKLVKRRQGDSERLYPDFPRDYLLIKITPLWLEGLLPGYRGDPVTWEPASVNFGQNGSSMNER